MHGPTAYGWYKNALTPALAQPRRCQQTTPETGQANHLPILRIEIQGYIFCLSKLKNKEEFEGGL